MLPHPPALGLLGSPAKPTSNYYARLPDRQLGCATPAGDAESTLPPAKINRPELRYVKGYSVHCKAYVRITQGNAGRNWFVGSLLLRGFFYSFEGRFIHSGRYSFEGPSYSYVNRNDGDPHSFVRS